MECPVCRQGELEVFFEAEGVPVYSNVLCEDRRRAVEIPRGDIRLGFCGNCGMIHNTAFDPAVMEYDEDYENSLHYSPRFQEFARELVKRLVRKYDLREKTIVEIGSGKGEFLRMICRAGGNRGIGFDPSYDPSSGAETEADGVDITFVSELYSRKQASRAADLIVSRHVLEHVPDPVEFLKEVRRAVGEKGTAVYFEVPDALWTIEEHGIWDIIYEHCSYFCDASLKRAFEEAGFRVVHVESAFGKQFLCLEAVAERAGAAEEVDGTTPLGRLARSVESFGASYRQTVDTWNQIIEKMPPGERVVLWGAGSKGVTFLNTVGAARRVEYIVDVNPKKQGKHVSGAGQRIVSPEFLREHDPHLVILMNPNYQEEVKRSLRELGVETAVAVV